MNPLKAQSTARHITVTLATKSQKFAASKDIQKAKAPWRAGQEKGAYMQHAPQNESNAWWGKRTSMSMNMSDTTGDNRARRNQSNREIKRNTKVTL